MLKRFWPRSLMGQMLLALALALLLAQAFGAVLLYRAQAERREATLVHAVAMRLFTATREFPDQRPDQRPGPRPEQREGFHGHHGPPPLPELFGGPRTFRVEHSATSPLRAGEPRMAHLEEELRELLAEQNIAMAAVVITKRQVSDDPGTLRRLARRAMLLRQPPDNVASKLLVTGIQREAGGEWLVVRAVMPPYERGLLATLVGQTLLIRKDLEGKIKTYKDLNDPQYRITSKVGTTGEMVAKKLISKAKYNGFDNEQEAVLDVVNGKADAFIYDAPYNVVAVNKAGAGKLVYLDEPFTYEPLAFGLKKGDYDSINWINNWLQQIRHDGTYDRLHAKWFKSTAWLKDME